MAHVHAAPIGLVQTVVCTSGSALPSATAARDQQIMIAITVAPMPHPMRKDFASVTLVGQETPVPRTPISLDSAIQSARAGVLGQPLTTVAAVCQTPTETPMARASVTRTTTVMTVA
jgi:hypothetical protein